MNYWLFKSEGACYSIDDFKKDKKTAWEGVRNFQARNFMMKDMCIGDSIFFYHSNGKGENPTGIYGLGKVVSYSHPDESQFNTQDEHYDKKSKKENPTWHCVDISFVKKFKEPIALSYIKIDPSLFGIRVAQVGSRLSIQPVSQKHGEYLISISQ
jgi:predicted RNA-binding protein with PUA-like domain